MLHAAIPSDEELEFIRSRWAKDSDDGEMIHRLCDAIVELKKSTDNRRTIPTPPPDEMDGVPVLQPLCTLTLAAYRCASCLDEFTPQLLPAECPSCCSNDVYPCDVASWPCGSCGKMKEGEDRCACGPQSVRLEDVAEEEA